MRISRRLGVVASGALSLLLAASLTGAEHASAATKTVRATQQTARAAAESWPAEDCSDDSYILKPDSITVEPKPLGRGKPLTITVHGNLRKAVLEGAYVKVTVKYGLIRLLSTTVDLAEELKAHNAPVQLPVEAGQISLPIYYGDFFADTTPPGTYSVSADAYTDDDEGLACVKATVTVLRP